MRRIQHTAINVTVVTLLGAMALAAPRFVAADTASAPSLTISQLKITSSNGQFIMLYNATDSLLDLSAYQLQYFNSYDLAKATSSKLIALTGTLPPHGYYLVNDSSLLLCYQMTIDSVSLGLSSTSGLLQVVKLSQPTLGGPAMPAVQDYVGWSKTTAAGAQTLPSSTAALLIRQPLDESARPYVLSPGSGSWLAVQPDKDDPCVLVAVSGGAGPVPQGPPLLTLGDEAPVTFLSDVPGSGGNGPVMPAGNIGLAAPQITELLPNPLGTGNDATNEFIELYNPNTANFDLTGFSLQVGLSTPKAYSFPSGTTLPPKSFVAFYADTTKLSLSNSGSQAKLLDPFGNAIASTEAYGTAKDGHAWANGKSKWYWTTEVTPGKANVIKEPAAAKKSNSSTSKSKPKSSSSAAVKKSGSSASSSSAGALQEEPATTPIHIRSLAIVGGLALLYGAYEYRTDMANRIHQLRQYLGARGGHRPESEGRRGNRVTQRLGRRQNRVRARPGSGPGQSRQSAQSELHSQQSVRSRPTHASPL